MLTMTRMSHTIGVVAARSAPLAFFLLCLLPLLGCETALSPTMTNATEEPNSTVTTPRPTTEASRGRCPESPPETLFKGPLHVLHIERHLFEGGNKVILELQGQDPQPPTEVKFRARRLDVEMSPVILSQPLAARSFIPSFGTIIEFPAAGCWDVQFQVGAHSLQFITEVYPDTYRPPGPADNNLASLADAVRNSEAILLVRAEGSTPDRPGFARRWVLVKEVWKGHLVEGAHLEILQVDEQTPVRYPGFFNAYESPLVSGGDYVVFLRLKEGKPIRILGPGVTLAEVDNGQIRPLPHPAYNPGEVWNEMSLSNARSRVKHLVETTVPSRQ